MTVFVSVDPATGNLRRYDSDEPQGLTHTGRLASWDGNVAGAIERFRATPVSTLKFDAGVEATDRGGPCAA